MSDDSMDGSAEGPSKQQPYFSKLLSGSSLLQIHVSTGKNLPKDGVKEFSPTNSWMELKQIQCALDERKELLDEERVDKWSCLAGAVWNHKKKLAEVTRRAGRHFQTLGFEKEGKLYLYPEEALYMLETNSLELDFGGVPVSIQQGYSLLLGPGTGCALNEYRAYSHLMRQGYRLLRFTNQIVHTKYERTIRLDQHAPVKRNHPGKAEKNVQNRSVKPRLNEAPKVEKHDDLSKEQVNEATSTSIEETPSVSENIGSDSTVECDSSGGQVDETSTAVMNPGEEFQTLQSTNHQDPSLTENAESSEKTNDEESTNLTGNNKTIDDVPNEESSKFCNDGGNQEPATEVDNETEVQDTAKGENGDQCEGIQQEEAVLPENDTTAELRTKAYGIAESLLSMGSTLMGNRPTENQNGTDKTNSPEKLTATLRSEILKMLGNQLDTGVSEDDLAAVASSAASTIFTHVSKSGNEDVTPDLLRSDKEVSSKENADSEAEENSSEESKATRTSPDRRPSLSSTNVEPICQNIDLNGSDDDSMGIIVEQYDDDSIGSGNNEGSQHLKRPATSQENMDEASTFKKAKMSDNHEDDIEILEYVPEEKHVELVDLSDESSMDAFPNSKANEAGSNSIEVIDVGDSSSSSSSDCTSSESNGSSVIVEERGSSSSGYNWDEERRRILEVFPNMHNFTEMTVRPPRFDLLPDNVEPQRLLYRINRQRLVQDGSGLKSPRDLDAQGADSRDGNYPYSAPSLPSPRSQRPLFSYAPRGNMRPSGPRWPGAPQSAMPDMPINPVEAVQAIARMVLPMLGLPANAFPPEQITSWVPNNAWFPHRPWGPRRGGGGPGPRQRPSGPRGMGMAPRFNQHPFRGNSFPRAARSRPFGPPRRLPRRYPRRGGGDPSYHHWQYPPGALVPNDEFAMSEAIPIQSTSRALLDDDGEAHGPSSWKQVKGTKPRQKKKKGEKTRMGRYFRPPQSCGHMHALLDKNQREREMSDSSPENANSPHVKTESESSDDDSTSENMDENDDDNDNNEVDSSLSNTDESCSSPTELKPLLSPRDCTDFESVFKSVQVIKEADTQSLVSTSYHQLKPQFDLFSPNKPFRKGNPPVPDFHLCIVGASDEVPGPGEIRVLMEALGDSVPVMFAVVCPDTICFFQACDVSLPSVTG